MRRTISFDDDVAAEIDRVRREESLTLSAVVNQLIRQGISSTREAQTYVHRSARLGLRVDVTNILPYGAASTSSNFGAASAWR